MHSHRRRRSQLLQLSQQATIQLGRLGMLRVEFQTLLVVEEGLLVVVTLKIPNRQVECCLEVRKLLETPLAPTYPTLLVTFALYHTNVIH